MRKILFILIILFSDFQLFSQVDDIEKQIQNYEHSKSVIISKGRSLLLERFLVNDIDKVKEIKDYLIEKGEDEYYLAFYPVEYWYILYWTREYEELSNSIKSFDILPVGSYYSSYSAGYAKKISPPKDMLFEHLNRRTREDALEILYQIKIAEIDKEMKDFLQLHLMTMTRRGVANQDSLNVLANNFLKTYPESEYTNFVKKHIKYKLVPQNWGYAFELFSGYGIHTGVLHDNYTNHVPLGLAFDICFWKIELYLRLYAGFNKSKIDFEYSNGTYPKGSPTEVFLPEATIGFAIFDKDRFKIAPYAGIGGIYIDPPSKKIEKTPELKDFSVFAYTCNFGANVDIKLGKKGTEYNPKTTYAFIRIRYGFCLAFHQKNTNEMHGNMHYITVGIGGFMRGQKREY